MKILPKVLAFIILLTILAFTPIKTKTVIIDVGHGGHDYGNHENGKNEKDITLNIALKVKQFAQNSNINIVLTRESDAYISLKDRVEFINSKKPNYMISLHANGYKNEETRGFEIFVNNNKEQGDTSTALAELISNDLAQTLPNRGVKESNFYILKHTECPAIMLELGFLTNPKDSKYLNSGKGQDEIAKAIFKSIQK